MKIVVLLVALVCVFGCSSGSAGTEDARFFQQGVSEQRAIDIIQNPRVCGIVLVRSRCLRDTGSLAGIVGERYVSDLRKGLAFARTGNISEFPVSLGYMNEIGPSSKLPWGAPRETWYLLAGVARVLGDGEDDLVHQIMAGDTMTGLRDHAARAGADASSLVPASASNAEIALRLRAAFPIEADPQVKTLSGPAGEYLRGTYVSTFNALGEVPVELMEPQSRSFTIALAHRDWDLGATVAGWTEETLDRAIATGTSPQAFRGWVLAVGSLNVSADERLGKAALPRILVGIYASQGADNAAVWREAPFDSEVRAHLSDAKSTADLPPAAMAARAAYLALKPGDWKAKNHALTALVLALQP